MRDASAGFIQSLDERSAMTTLRTKQLADLSPDDQAIVERVAQRMGQRPEDVLRPGIFGVQAHWPA